MPRSSVQPFIFHLFAKSGSMLVDRIKRSWPLGWEHVVRDVAEGAFGYAVHNKAYSLLDKRSGPIKYRMHHVGVFSRYNAGDAYLPVILRDLFENQLGRIAWTKQHAHKVITEKDIERFNKSDGLVIGGGGLFLADTNPNTLSGWQWSCSLELLAKITCPIFVFAVGYNRFRGQEDFSPLFTKHLRLLVRKSSFFGLRNYGSVSRIKDYLPKDLHHKVSFQPCMTTISSRVYGEKSLRSAEAENYIAVNCAFDRAHLRFGDTIGEKLTNLAKGLKKLSEIMPLKLMVHSPRDENFSIFLDGMGIPYTLVDLTQVHPSVILKTYTEPVVVLGMRGHAQLIPFGCERPIYSLITHNKLQYFLDDIGHKEWGCDLRQEGFADKMVEEVSSIIDNLSSVEGQVTRAQDQLWKISCDNLKIIESKLK